MDQDTRNSPHLRSPFGLNRDILPESMLAMAMRSFGSLRMVFEQDLGLLARSLSGIFRGYGNIGKWMGYVYNQDFLLGLPGTDRVPYTESPKAQ